MSKFKKGTEENSKICTFGMLPAKVSGHQVTPGWPGTDLRGWVSTSPRWGQDTEEFPTLIIRASKMTQTSASYSCSLWSSDLEKSRAEISHLPTALSGVGGKFMAGQAELQSAAVAFPGGKHDLLCVQWEPQLLTGQAPAWKNIPLVASILPAADPPGLLLLWASSRSQPAKHSVGESRKVILQ